MALRKLFKNRTEKKELGVTRRDVQRALLALDAEDPIDDDPVELTAAALMATLRATREDDYCRAEKAGFDFDAFLEFLQRLIEMLMPFIIKNRPPVVA